MKPIHKLNNGRGATLCHACSVIITVGATNDLYCDRCLKARIKTREEFKAIIKNSKAFYDQMEKEAHFNRSNINM